MDGFEHAALVVAALVLAGLLPMRGKWNAALRQPLPEARICVSSDDSGIVCAHPGRKVMTVAWHEVTGVCIQTTSHGPWAADVFWVIETCEGSPPLVFPSGASGEQAVLDDLAARLPGFDRGAVVAAMSCTAERVFVVWRKAATT